MPPIGNFHPVERNFEHTDGNGVSERHTAGQAAQQPRALWCAAMRRLSTEIQTRQLHPADVVVLLPYAQLMPIARQEWVATIGPNGFTPRFETTQNWPKSLAAVALGPDDLCLDAALDALAAARLLQRSGMGNLADLLAQRVMAAAWELAPTAMSIAPHHRLAWAQSLSASLFAGMDSPGLAMEVAVGRIALAWVGSSGFASDSLFTQKPELLFVVQGFQLDPLAQALAASNVGRAVHVTLADLSPTLTLPEAAQAANGQVATGQRVDVRVVPSYSLHETQNAQDEAEVAASTVLRHLANGTKPVALVAIDRMLTRRVRALLEKYKLQFRDETGWKLSTTRAAANLLSVLRACQLGASGDEVMDALKNSQLLHVAERAELESALRKNAKREWPQGSDPAEPDNTTLLEVWPLVCRVNQLRENMRASRTIVLWQVALQEQLTLWGLWDQLVEDHAGSRVLEAVHCRQIHPHFEAHLQPVRLAEFLVWVQTVLEAGNFVPPHPMEADLVILPLSQLLGRSFGAVVLAGCDELNLAVIPPLPVRWTVEQAAMLGMADRARLMQGLRGAWGYALQQANVHILWRKSEGGETLQPSYLVQQVLLRTARHEAANWAPDPRHLLSVDVAPVHPPAPACATLSPAKISSSAYEDLRKCPYRFHVLRQLKLSAVNELEAELDKRDFGVWLHLLLYDFHEAARELLVSQNFAMDQALVLINQAAMVAKKTLGLSDSEFLPFEAAWPSVRSGYLHWLADNSQKQTYLLGEAWMQRDLIVTQLVGKIDRVDQDANGHWHLLDYKTESSIKTKARVKSGSAEDVQLPFYAALASTQPNLRASYLNVGERGETVAFELDEIGNKRDRLLSGVQSDMQRIADGAPLPALGGGGTCDHCDARGLCRKDFWNPAEVGE